MTLHLPAVVTLGKRSVALRVPDVFTQIRFGAAHKADDGGLVQGLDAQRLAFAAIGICWDGPVPWEPTRDLLELGERVAETISPWAGTLKAWTLANEVSGAVFDLLNPDSAEVEEAVGNSAAPGEQESSAGATPPTVDSETPSVGSP